MPSASATEGPRHRSYPGVGAQVPGCASSMSAATSRRIARPRDASRLAALPVERLGNLTTRLRDAAARDFGDPETGSVVRRGGRRSVEQEGVTRMQPAERNEMPGYKVGYFVGSLSSASINRVLARALIRLAPEDLEFSEIGIDNLPLYSPDFDDHYPPEATALKKAIAHSDAVLFVTPEYNPVHSRRTEERHRLGVPSMGPELVPPHPRRCHRGIDRSDRHRGGATEPSRGAELLQRSADDLTGGVHPVLAECVRGRRRGDQRGDRDLPSHLHDGVPGLRGTGPDGPPPRPGSRAPGLMTVGLRSSGSPVMSMLTPMRSWCTVPED